MISPDEYDTLNRLDYGQKPTRYKKIDQNLLRVIVFLLLIEMKGS